MMAAPAVELETVSRPGRSPKTRASSLRHKVRSQNVVMKESEQSLHKLMEDFELGRLNAFGENYDAILISMSCFALCIS